MAAKLLILALLRLFHSSPERACMERRSHVIARNANAAEAEHGTPAGILLLVAFAETHIGCDHGEGGNWGAPISRTRRHTAGTHDHAARALARSYEVCHTWHGAVSRFRCGLCVCPSTRPGYSANYAIRTSQALYEEAGLPLPENMELPPGARRARRGRRVHARNP